MSKRSAARTFDYPAEIYERARPGWPVEALDYVIERLGLDQAGVALDLGAGTGKLTRMLVDRFATVFAVEPLDGMRTLLESLVPTAATHPGNAEGSRSGRARST